MADNIINPDGLTEKGPETSEEFIAPEKPDEELSSRFSGLVSSENESNLSGSANNKFAAPETFSEMQEKGNEAPAVQIDNSEQAGLGTDSDSLKEANSPETTVDVDQVEFVTNQIFSGGSVLGENIDPLPEAGTLGDRILRGMQGIRERVEDGARQVEAHLDPASETMNMREMFHTQWTMSNLMITEDYIGKVVSKGTQAFDTLLRNQ
ncbi:EscI/YscI/HrpB family type III secretion system inner rod protein [Endozoicomonas sp. Mp262]|uniref:EscI/YscI/HrpB family type III secretion system inner rod protein n=1 Tax=Endozoicomonas sp. Mp262 TaxID=2919499 RepID=UPI0021D89E6F